MKKGKKHNQRGLIADLFLLGGAAAMALGAGLFCLPAGLMVGGLCGILIAVLLGLGGGDNAA